MTVNVRLEVDSAANLCTIFFSETSTTVIQGQGNAKSHIYANIQLLLHCYTVVKF